MEFITVAVIAIALALDAFAVSIVSGSTYNKLNIAHAFRIALFFGAFQAFMPLIGSLAGLTIKKYIENYDHWIAFALLAVVGGKMVCESFKMKSEKDNADPSNMLVLLVLAVATSIDALAVGLTLSLITSHIPAAVTVIGLVTFTLSFLGVYIGKKVGHFFENRIEAAGGLILIAIGIKIIFQHLL
ncbi:MAG: manganese efflux pump [Candidatus Brocadiia bacterium]|nr:MAG: manganese efflux pump [Candidatus Brocadiia bacterium]